MKIENLKERIWLLKNNPVFTKAVLEKHKYLESDINACEYGQAIYIDGDKPELMCSTIFHPHEPVETGCFDVFRRHLKHFDTKSFMEVLYAIDSYKITNYGQKPKLPKIKTSFKGNRIVDDLLNDSKGVMLWHYQLENFYLFLDNNKEDAIKFRKGILAKKSIIFEIAKNIRIDYDTTLKDVIDERMIYCSTISPSYKEARELYQYLNKAH